MRVRVHACVHACVCVACVSVCIHACVCVFMRVYSCVCVHACMFIRDRSVHCMYVVISGAVCEVFVEQLPPLSGRTMCLYDTQQPSDSGRGQDRISSASNGTTFQRLDSIDTFHA